MLSRIYCRCYQSWQVEACSEFLDPLNMTSYSSLTGNPTQVLWLIKLIYIISSSANPGYLGRCVRSIITGHSGDDIICQVGHLSHFFLFYCLHFKEPSVPLSRQCNSLPCCETGEHYEIKGKST